MSKLLKIENTLDCPYRDKYGVCQNLQGFVYCKVKICPLADAEDILKAARRYAGEHGMEKLKEELKKMGAE